METNKGTTGQGTTGTTGTTGTSGGTGSTGQGATGSTNRPAGAAGGVTGGGSAAQRAQDQAGGTSEVIDQARQTITDAYGRTSETLNATYDQAMDYGREHPGQLTLIAFGAGIGIGLLLASGFGSRSRTSRIVPPVMNALTEIARELIH